MVVDFTVNGDLRFVAHQEMLRAFARACSRAGIPVARTAGFNPHPRISIPLPRPVGVASDAERLVLELSEFIPPDVLSSRLGAQMPEGIEIVSARAIEPRERCLPLCARYRADATGVSEARLQEGVDRFARFAPIYHERVIHRTGSRVRVDLRPYADEVACASSKVSFTLHITGGGSAKPSEVCAVLGIGDEHVNHLIRRTEVTWLPIRLESQ